MSLLRAAAGLLVLAVLAGNVVRVPVFAAANKEAPLLPLDLALGIFLVIAATEILRRRKFAFDSPALWGSAFVTVAIIGLATAGKRVGLAPLEVLFSAAYLARWTGYFLIFVLAGALLAPRDATAVATTIRRVIVTFTAFGIVQAAFFPDFALMIHPESRAILDWDPQRNRLVSTMLDPNYAGVLIVVGLAMWGSRVLAQAPVKWWEGVVLLTGLVLTLSRGAALAAASAAVAITLAHGVSRRALRSAALAGLALVAASPFVFDFASAFNKLTVDASALSRLLAWQRNLTLIAEHPLLGIGFNSVGFVARQKGWPTLAVSGFGLDGGLLFITALTGIVGLAAFVGFLVAVLRSAQASWRDANASPDERAVALAVAGSLTAVIVHSFFANTIALPLVLAPCWLLWALPRVHRRGRTTTS